MTEIVVAVIGVVGIVVTWYVRGWYDDRNERRKNQRLAFDELYEPLYASVVRPWGGPPGDNPADWHREELKNMLERAVALISKKVRYAEPLLRDRLWSWKEDADSASRDQLLVEVRWLHEYAETKFDEMRKKLKMQ